MNIKSFTLTIISLAVAGIAVAQPTLAQEGKRPSPRFDFAPNTWKQEQPNVPKRWCAPTPMANVRSGGVPSRAAFGIDPTFLAKAPPPTSFSTLATPVRIMNTTPKLLPQPQVNAAFHPSFGRAATLAPPLVAAVPQGLAAQPSTARPMSSSKSSLSGRLMPHHIAHSKVGVSGRLLTPQHPAQSVASYGQGIGYVPGSFVPTPVSGSGMGTNSVVHGRIIRH